MRLPRPMGRKYSSRPPGAIPSHWHRINARKVNRTSQLGVGETAMKALIWKEWRENLKWLPLPSLVILLVFLIDKPDTPMFAATDAYFFCVIAAVFGAALGFVQIFFEG